MKLLILNLNRIHIVGLVCSLISSSIMAEMVAVVSANSTIDTLSINQTVDIFLGKTTRFPDGSRAVPIDQIEGSSEREEFYQQFSGKSPEQLKAHWSKIIFTGRGQPPKEVASSDEVKQHMQDNPNAIGYIDKSKVDDSVKVILE